MADQIDIVKIGALGNTGNDEINITYREMPDGTFAKVVSANVESNSYLGEETITATGGSDEATVPSGTKAIWMFPEGGLGRGTVNGDASVNSGVYAPDGGARFIGHFDNISSFAVLADADVKIHLIYLG